VNRRCEIFKCWEAVARSRAGERARFGERIQRKARNFLGGGGRCDFSRAKTTRKGGTEIAKKKGGKERHHENRAAFLHRHEKSSHSRGRNGRS